MEQFETTWIFRITNKIFHLDAFARSLSTNKNHNILGEKSLLNSNFQIEFNVWDYMDECLDADKPIEKFTFNICGDSNE